MKSAHMETVLRLEEALYAAKASSLLRALEIGARKPAARMAEREGFYALKHKHVLGFEADEAEAERLKDELSDHDDLTYLPVGLAGSCGSRTLHITRHPKCSSLLPPNMSLIAQYPNLAVASPDHSCTIETIDLATALRRAGWDSVDFIKMDVQGAELEILQGCPDVLDNVVLVCTEVGFGEVYKHQPLFCDINQFMLGRGFEIHHIVQMGGGKYYERVSGHPQILWGDVVYIRPPRSLSREQRLKLAILAGLYDAHHLALHCLELESKDPAIAAARDAYSKAVVTRDKNSSPARIAKRLIKRLLRP